MLFRGTVRAITICPEDMLKVQYHTSVQGRRAWRGLLPEFNWPTVLTLQTSVGLRMGHVDCLWLITHAWSGCMAWLGVFLRATSLDAFGGVTTCPCSRSTFRTIVVQLVIGQRKKEKRRLECVWRPRGGRSLVFGGPAWCIGVAETRGNGTDDAADDGCRMQDGAWCKVHGARHTWSIFANAKQIHAAHYHLEGLCFVRCIRSTQHTITHTTTHTHAVHHTAILARYARAARLSPHMRMCHIRGVSHVRVPLPRRNRRARTVQYL